MSKSKVIAITNQKGGVGKTVTSISLGACLAKDNKKAIVIQTPTLTALRMFYLIRLMKRI